MREEPAFGDNPYGRKKKMTYKHNNILSQETPLMMPGLKINIKKAPEMSDRRQPGL